MLWIQISEFSQDNGTLSLSDLLNRKEQGDRWQPRYSLMENSAGAMPGNTKTWLWCFVLVQPGTHSVLTMPTWTFIKSPDLVFIFFCVWNSCFPFDLGSKMQANTNGMWPVKGSTEPLKHRQDSLKCLLQALLPHNLGRERLILPPGCLVLPPAPVSPAVKLRCSW